jgi:hypothetical protein
MSMSQTDLSNSPETPRSPGRKRLRLALIAAASAAGLGLLALHRPTGREGFTTPTECVEAYAAASKGGDGERYLRCLAEPLRSRTRQHFPEPGRLAEALRQEMEGVKGWVVASAPVIEGNTAGADVDVVRQDGVRRLHFRLERPGGGWLVAGVSSPQARPAAIPYGTHVKGVGGELDAEPDEEIQTTEAQRHRGRTEDP